MIVTRPTLLGCITHYHESWCTFKMYVMWSHNPYLNIDISSLYAPCDTVYIYWNHVYSKLYLKGYIWYIPTHPATPSTLFNVHYTGQKLVSTWQIAIYTYICSRMVKYILHNYVDLLLIQKQYSLVICWCLLKMMHSSTG